MGKLRGPVRIILLLGLVVVTACEPNSRSSSTPFPSVATALSVESRSPLPMALPTPTPLPTPTALPTPTPRPAPIMGRVVSVDGKPVVGAVVSSLQSTTTTNHDGAFELAAAGAPQWVTVQHPSFLSRTRAATPASPVLVRLTPDDGETVSIHFTGDVMLGRRFYDPNEDGDTSDGLLRPGDGADKHLALLRHVRPLLENAHLTVVNLETPLTSDPYVDPTRPRPAGFHPTKEFVFASHPVTAIALREAGVDVTGLANNHLFDTLDRGISETQNALEQAGFQPGAGYFGVGSSEMEAWTPAVANVRGQSIAFLGCTTITGVEHALAYVVSPTQAGAAGCNAKKIKTAVAAARATHDVVVFMIHGGYEYGRDPSENIQKLSALAQEAGATLVINHHPHVVGGFNWNGQSLTAWTLGNFVFDQTVWPTFESYLLRVELRRGKVVRAYTEPLMIEGFVPKGLTGRLADFVARGAAGRAPGPFRFEDGAMEVDVQGMAQRYDVPVPIDAEPSTGTIYHLEPGWWVSGFQGSGTIRLGRDLLWVGTFEDEDVDAQTRGGALWDLAGYDDKRIGPEYAYAGKVGARIQRGAPNTTNIVLTPLHRILVQSGTEISVVGIVRSQRHARLSLQLSWYADTKGASATQTAVPIAVKSDNVWTPFRLDVTVPPNTVALGLFLKLKPPTSGITVADFDNLAVIEWAPSDRSFSPLYDHIRVTGAGKAILSRDQLPGANLPASSSNALVLAP